MKEEKCFSEADLEAIAKVLGDTQTGLTGSEIANMLTRSEIPDVDPLNTKWKRLYNAFVEEQNKRKYGNHIIAFIHKSMNPSLYVSTPEYYEQKRTEVNKVLAFSGLTLGDDGKVRRITKVSTIQEAEERADKLKRILKGRGVHDDVLKYCKSELLVSNYFHTVLEASKSVAQKIRDLSGLASDGAELATQAFSFGKSGKPVIAINSLSNDSEISEQKGFLNLLIGIFGTFRNPTAHAVKIYWPINEEDALDILSIISYIHRKLDKAKIL